MVAPQAAAKWADALFRVSLLKQEKVREISRMFPKLEGIDCLDVGGDNGVVSLMFRRMGGSWTSADLDQESVDAIRAVVGERVALIDRTHMPFANRRFDCVVLADCLEHIVDDQTLVAEVHRILKPEGTLIVNVPLARNGLLRRLRLALGQTDSRHGHVRQGYSVASLTGLLGSDFVPVACRTYSRFFTQLVDTLVVAGVRALGASSHQAKGTVVTQEASGKKLRIAKLIYPLVWIVSQLDRLIFFTQGYMLIVKARANVVEIGSSR